jgi:parallel beta helix pectate lyase-like protein
MGRFRVLAVMAIVGMALGGCANQAYPSPEPRAKAAPPPADGCDVTVPAGADNVPETPAANTTYCLRGGVHTEGDRLWRVTNPGVQIRSYPGETAEMRGSIRTFETGTGFTLGQPGTAWPNTQGGVRVDASYGVQREPGYNECPLGCDRHSTQGLHLDADGLTVEGNSISNRRPNGDTALAGTCVLLPDGADPGDASIRGNFVHGCGQLPRNNHEHAIYASGLHDSVIADNLIVGSADRSIQLYAAPRSNEVVGNVVSGGNDNFVFGSQATAQNVRNNVVVNAADDNVYDGPKLSGAGNRFDGNCAWLPGGAGGVSTGPGLSASANVTAHPRFDSSPGDGVVKVTNPACAAKLPAGSRFRP